MKNFVIYQQGLPLEMQNGKMKLNLQPVGESKAVDGKTAINNARKMPCFRIGKGLGRYPIVEEVDEKGNPVPYQSPFREEEDERIMH